MKGGVRLTPQKKLPSKSTDLFDLFHASVFLCPLKISGNQRFSDVFRRYK